MHVRLPQPLTAALLFGQRITQRFHGFVYGLKHFFVVLALLKHGFQQFFGVVVPCSRRQPGQRVAFYLKLHCPPSQGHGALFLKYVLPCPHVFKGEFWCKVS